MSMIIAPSYRDFVEGRQPQNVTQENIKSNTQNEDSFIPVVYGLRRVVAPIIWMGNSDFDNSLICIYALSEGPCYGVYRLFVNGEYVRTNATLSTASAIVPTGQETFVKYNGTGNAATLINPVNSVYNDILELEYRSGWEDYYVNVEGSTATEYQHKILNNHIADPTRRPKFNNLSYLICRFIYDGPDTPYGDTVPSITVDMFGKMTQPHTDTVKWNWTISESANTTAGTSASTAFIYTTNPVAHLKDYMSDTLYGAGLPFNSINQTSFESVYDDCNDISAYNLTNGKTYYGNRYTSNMLLDTSQQVIQNLQSILDTNMLLMPYSEGEFKLVLETGGNPEVTFTENSIIDEIKITYPDANSRYNSVYYSYPDAEDSWLTRRGRFPASDADVQTLITADDGNINNLNLSLPSITNPYLAEQLAKQQLEKSRNQIKVEFTIFKDAWKYQVGDLVQLTTNLPDLTAFEIRIVSMRLDRDDLIKIIAYSHIDENYIPFGDFPQSPFDYIKPLIPVKGGFIKPSRPTDPISVIPPSTPNPDSGEPGAPSEPSDKPFIPIQPGEDLPTTPGTSSFFYNSSNVLNFGSAELLGPNNEYMIAKLRYSSNPSYTYELDPEWQSPSSIGQLRFRYDFDTNNPAYPRYEWQCALTHRNGVEESVCYVYEIAQNASGKILYGHALNYPSKWNRYHYYWDPENPTDTFKIRDLTTNDAPLEYPIKLFNPPKMLNYTNPRGYINGTLVPEQPIDYSSLGGVFQPLTFPVIGSVYRNANYGAGNLNYLELEPGGKTVPGNFYGGNSASSFTIKIKFFTIKGLKPFVMGRYLGEKTITFGNANLTLPYVDDSRQQHGVSAPGTTAPF